ncbi:MAG TPA: hypothetical protein VM912_02305, partial [Terriglobales bacterium]|nr:hypothetical protein [Terriglobales bacterium]
QLRLFSPQLADRMFIFVLPELAYVIAICRLWKNQRPVAFGVLLAAVILFTHVLVHHANHVGRRADAVRDDAWTLSDKSKGLRQTRAGSI